MNKTVRVRVRVRNNPKSFPSVSFEFYTKWSQLTAGHKITNALDAFSDNFWTVV